MEIWKDITGYEELYQISNYGRVRSLDRYDSMGRFKEGIMLKTYDNGNGYKKITLYKNGLCKTFSVHRLVAIAFIPNDNNLPQINHKDENPSNNHVDNLEWCTNEYNSNYGNHNLHLSMAHTGKILTEEHKKNISNASKERWKNEDYRNKIIASKIGSKHSEETKRKMSDSAKKKVRCIETGEVFDSMQEAAERYNRDYTNLGRAIKNNKRFAGYHWELVI